MMVRSSVRTTPTNESKPLSQERGFFILDILKGTMMEKEAFHVNEFCQRYAISRTSLYKEVLENRLSLIKRGRRTLISRTEAERWFSAHAGQPETK